MDKVPHKDFCIIMVIIFTLIIFLIFWSCMITSFVSSYSYIICVQVRLLNEKSAFRYKRLIHMQTTMNMIWLEGYN